MNIFKTLSQTYYRYRGFHPLRCFLFGHQKNDAKRYALQRGDQIFDYVWCEREGGYFEESVSQIKRPQGQPEEINDLLFR